MADLSLLHLVGGVGLREDVEWLLHLVVDDPTGIDVEPSEERFVQDGAHYLVAALIGCLGFFQERQRRRGCA
jgi:hypothetical protein